MKTMTILAGLSICTLCTVMLLGVHAEMTSTTDVLLGKILLRLKNIAAILEGKKKSGFATPGNTEEQNVDYNVVKNLEENKVDQRNAGLNSEDYDYPFVHHYLPEKQREYQWRMPMGPATIDSPRKPFYLHDAFPNNKYNTYDKENKNNQRKKPNKDENIKMHEDDVLIMPKFYGTEYSDIFRRHFAPENPNSNEPYNLDSNGNSNNNFNINTNNNNNKNKSKKRDNYRRIMDIQNSA